MILERTDPFMNSLETFTNQLIQHGTDLGAKLLSALVVLVIAAVYLATMLFAMLSEQAEDFVAWLVVGIYCLLVAAVIAGVLIALNQRLRELDGGEEEDAKKY